MDPNQEKMSTYQIYQIPYAKNIDVIVDDAKGISTVSNIRVTEGKDMQTQAFESAETLLKSDGAKPITIQFKDKEQKAVWLNSFVLSEWFL